MIIAWENISLLFFPFYGSVRVSHTFFGCGGGYRKREQPSTTRHFREKTERTAKKLHKTSVERFAIFEKLVFAITSRILRILMEHIQGVLI